MGHALYLTDGTTTAHLGDGGSNLLLGYTPAAPTSVETENAEINEATVTESATVVFTGATADAVRAAVRTVETLLLEATQRERTKAGRRVYVKRKLDGTSDTYRSEVMSGRVEMSDKALDSGWWNRQIEALVVWTRRFYWEADAEATLVNGAVVYSHEDAGHHNYVDIGGASVAGSLPTPLRMVLVNSDGTVASDVYVASNTMTNPATLPHALEGEASAGVTALPASPDLNSYSGGRYGRKALSGTESNLFSWSLPTSTFQGQYYRLIARFAAAPPANTQIRVHMGIGSNVLWQNESLITLSAEEMQEICTMQIPPALVNVPSTAAIDLIVRGKGAGNLDLDFVQLLPTETYRKLLRTLSTLAVGSKLVDDGIDDLLYTTNGANANAAPDYVGFGIRPRVWPGLATRLYFLAADGGVDHPLRQLTVYAYHRPRVLTL